MDILVIQGSHNDCLRRVGGSNGHKFKRRDGNLLLGGNRWVYKEENKLTFPFNE